jgi:TolB-like protein
MKALNAGLIRSLPELRRGRLWKVGAVYVLVALAVVEAADNLLPRLLLPDWTVTLVVMLAVLGLPLALVLAWSYSPASEGSRTGGGELALEQAVASPAADSASVAAPSDPVRPTDAGGSVAPPYDCSIVVLPFDDLSPEADSEYFSDGLTEEIITDLSRLRSLRVISRTSAMLLKGSGKDVRTIGRELGVRYVLEGSVRKAGDRLRVTAQLIDTSTDAHLWAERYDGDLGDVFSIQESVARSIADALRIELSPEEEAAIAAVPMTDTYAYECVLRARHEIWSGSAASVRKAIEYLKAAQEVVGENVAVLSALGEAHYMLPHITGEGMKDLADHLDDIAQRILRLDPDSAAGHFNKGLALLKRPWGFKESLREFRKATALEATNTSMLVFHAYFAAEVCCTAEALTVTDRLLQIDPLSPLVRLNRSYVCTLDGQFDTAVEQARRSAAADPANYYFRWCVMFALVQTGDLERIEELVQDFPEPLPDNWARSMALHHAAMTGQDLDPILSPELLSTARGDETFSFVLAQCLAQAGRTEEALDWLENALSLGFTNPEFLGETDRLLEPVRGEPRFQQLLEKAKAVAEELRVESEGAPQYARLQPT